MYCSSVTIDFLYNSKQLSTRAYTSCQNHQLKSLKDLKEHLKKNGNFKSIKGCGRKVNKELLKISKQNEDFFKIELNDIETSSIFDYQFETKFNEQFRKKMGISAQNALAKYLDYTFTKEQIEKYIIGKDFSKIKLTNVGEKTSIEIVRFIAIIMSCIVVLFLQR
jgi:hypothetical protein